MIIFYNLLSGISKAANMRIQLLDYDVDDNSINVDNINHIISYNGGGKTKLCDLLYEGFEGKLTKKN